MSLTPASTANRYQFPLASRDLGIAQTVLLMERLVRTGARDPDVREHALTIAAHVGQDPAAQAAAIFRWMKANFRFQPDAHGKEVVGDVRYLLQVRTGDCDDYVVALGALLESIGIPTRIVTIAADKREPGRFSHTYLEARIGGQWMPLDATQDHAPPGWEPPYYFRKRAWGPMMTGFGKRRLRWERPPGVRAGLGFDISSFLPGIIQTGEAVGQAAAARIAYGPMTPYVYGSVPAPAATSLGIQTVPGGVVASIGGGQIPTIVWVGAGLILVLLFTRK